MQLAAEKMQQGPPRNTHPRVTLAADVNLFRARLGDKAKRLSMATAQNKTPQQIMRLAAHNKSRRSFED